MEDPYFAYKTYFENSSVASGVFDSSGNAVIVNKSFNVLFGIKEVIAKLNFNLFTYQIIQEEYLNLIRNEKTISIVVFIDFEKLKDSADYKITRDGYMWLHVDIEPYKENDELFYIVTLIDQTKEKELEIEMINKEKIFESILDKNDLPMIFIDRKTNKILKVNKAANDFYGYPKAQLKRMRMTDLISEVISEDGIKSLYYFKHKLANGEIHDVEVISTPMKFENKEIVFSIIKDNTQDRLIEKELRSKVEIFENIFENAPLGVITMDVEGKLLSSNKYMLETSEYKKEEINNKDFKDLIYSEDSEKGLDVIAKITKEKKTYYNFELKIKTKTGKIKVLNISSCLISDSNKNPLLIVAFFEDVTVKKKDEEKHIKLLLKIKNLHKDLTEITNMMLDVPENNNSDTLKTLGVTEREIEIVSLLIIGYKNKDIAEKLFISEETVKTHISRIYKKFDVGNRIELNNFIREKNIYI
jgi:PAS domain S-box-containing protein